MATVYQNTDWWKIKESRVHEALFPYLKVLDKDQSYRTYENIRNMRLYGNYPIQGLNIHNYSKAEPAASIQNRLTLNVVQAMVDTAVSKLTKNKPKPMFLTSGGDWSLQQKAKKLTKFINGQFNTIKFYTKAQQAFKDATIFGTGAVKIYRDHTNPAKICSERVFIDELIIDDVESFYGEPKQIHQRKYIHRETLKKMFPDFEGKINICDDGYKHNNYSHKNRDMILVIESWRLPTVQGAKDGKHTICIENADLLDEVYKKDYFPFVFFRWNVRPIGFFGQGIAEILQGLQLEMNKILKTIQISMHLTAVPKVFMSADSKVVSAHINNKIGGIIKYAGREPIIRGIDAVPTVLFEQLDRLYQRSFQLVGISQLSSQSQKPSGLDSGKALRTFHDIETERFMEVGQRYEDSFLTASKILIDLAKEISVDFPNMETKVKGGKFLETIKWSEVDIDEDSYMMEIFPTSKLSDTPSGRLSDIQDLLNAGLIDPQEARKLLDFPDLERENDINNADSEDIDALIERMIDDGKYEAPEPYQNIVKGKIKMQKAYLYYKRQGAPEDRLELLRNWIESAQAMLSPDIPVAPAQTPVAPGTAEPVEAPLVPPVIPENAT